MTELSTNSQIESPLLSLERDSGAQIGNWFSCALPDDFGDWLAEYRALRESVALIEKNYRAYLRFTGPDRVRYLNAILTNNVKDLATGLGVPSLFLNPQGRIQAEIETYAEPDALFCISYAMIREQLIPALDKFIIMDDVTLADESEHFGTLALEGPGAANLVAKLANVDLLATRDFSFNEISVAGIACKLIRRSPGGIAGAEFLVNKSDLAKLWTALLNAAKSADGRAAGYNALNALRLEQNIPWFGYDFGDKQIPHEAGLQDSHISYTKGCYTGQEIVERVRSRGQVNRVRTLFQISANEPPAAGTPLLADGKEAGHLTRAAFSPALNAPIAMGYVRREKSEIGTILECGTSMATVIAAPLATK